MKTLILSLLFLVSCSTTKNPGQTTVEFVDLERFMGNWFEVARYVTPLQNECGAAKITYKMKKKEIEMIHACHEKIGKKTKVKRVTGLGEVSDMKTNAKWKVSYLPVFKNWHMFASSIWIVSLDPDYQYAILGHPTHKHLWILSRTPEISPEKYEELLAIAQSKGYKTKELIRVPVWK